MGGIANWLADRPGRGDLSGGRDENGEQTVAAPAGSVILCRPHATDSFVWDAHKRTRHAFFHFRIESLPVIWSNFATWPFVRLPERDDLLRPLFRHVLHGAQQLQKAASPNIEYSITHNQSEKRALSLRLSIAHLLTSFVDGDFDMATEFAPRKLARFGRARLEFHPSQSRRNAPQ